MKKICTAVLVILSTGTLILAAHSDRQKQSTASANSSASANTQTSAKPRAITLDSGTQIDTEITSTLNLKKAKPGDSFKLKTIKPVKKQGKEIISKGSTIIGHVQQSTNANDTTQATLVFDQLVDNKTHVTSTLSAVVTAITKPATASAMTQDDTMATVPSGGGRAQQGTSQGGLLGGVTQTVGGVTQTAGGVSGSAGSTVSSTTNATLGSTVGTTGAVGSTAGGLSRGTIQIVNDATASAASGSTLTMATRNAKLESGTQFVLQTTSALTLTREPKKR